ncbi:PKD domain-containing protein [Phytohabitans sp. LJ34]|uniref:PKD domain-containing protein n=1 Tax=Phytohabitans sp. LJ34 TaxID=3452217 RepID=UPI003F8CC27A
MRRTFRAGITAIALTGGTVVGVVTPAHAAAPVLYVKQDAAVCADTGAGTQQQPFCTIGAAAAVAGAGQSVEIANGQYGERVTIARSGTPERPIVFRAATDAVVQLSGPTAGIVIDGQHDIVLRGIRVNGGTDAPALDVSRSSAIAVDGGSYTMSGTPATVPAIRLAEVHASTLKNISVAGRVPDGIHIDTYSSGVVVDTVSVSGPVSDDGRLADGIEVGGRDNQVINSTVDGWTGAAILVWHTAADTLVVNNQVNGGPGHGIHSRGPLRTYIVNNTVKNRCADGIRADAFTSSTSIENNVLIDNGTFDANLCGEAPADGVDIGIYEDAVGHTRVGWNNTRKRDGKLNYAWDGTRMNAHTFFLTSGEGAGDRETLDATEDIDSAYEAAFGYPQTDRLGRARIDDPDVPNTGVGVDGGYADRGAVEASHLPEPRATFALDLAAATVKVDASTSLPGTVPIASYEVDFGDGTIVKQTSPVVSHRYANPGTFNVKTTAIGTDGLSASRTDQISVLRATATAGLISLPLLRYVGGSQSGTSLDVNRDSLTTDAQLDLADAGSGHVAILHRATGKYASADTAGTQTLRLGRVAVGNTEKFTLIRNADGSISLKSVASGRYLSIVALDNPFLIASRTAIGAWEKFYQVKIVDAARSFKASANGKFVSAEQAGTKPLIASRPAANLWEKFDIVDLGSGKVALFARVNNKFVAAESGGTKPLLAGRVAVSSWETFTLIRNSDGTVSFKAAANNLYVSAEQAGAQPLIASRPAINTWEKYTMS